MSSVVCNIIMCMYPGFGLQLLFPELTKALPLQPPPPQGKAQHWDHLSLKTREART